MIDIRILKPGSLITFTERTLTSCGTTTIVPGEALVFLEWKSEKKEIQAYPRNLRGRRSVPKRTARTYLSMQVLHGYKLLWVKLGNFNNELAIPSDLKENSYLIYWINQLS